MCMDSILDISCSACIPICPALCKAPFSYPTSLLRFCEAGPDCLQQQKTSIPCSASISIVTSYAMKQQHRIIQEHSTLYQLVNSTTCKREHVYHEGTWSCQCRTVDDGEASSFNFAKYYTCEISSAFLEMRDTRPVSQLSKSLADVGLDTNPQELTYRRSTS